MIILTQECSNHYEAGAAMAMLVFFCCWSEDVQRAKSKLQVKALANHAHNY